MRGMNEEFGNNCAQRSTHFEPCMITAPPLFSVKTHSQPTSESAHVSRIKPYSCISIRPVPHSTRKWVTLLAPWEYVAMVTKPAPYLVKTDRSFV